MATYRKPIRSSNWGKHPNVLAAALYNARSKRRDAGPYLGEELIDEGDFENAGDWVLGTGWTLIDGSAHAGGVASALTQDVPKVNPRSNYRLDIVFADDTVYNEGLEVVLGGDTVDTITSDDGTYTGDVVAGTTDTELAFVVSPDDSFTGSIESVSLKAIIGDTSEVVFSGEILDLVSGI